MYIGLVYLADSVMYMIASVITGPLLRHFVSKSIHIAVDLAHLIFLIHVPLELQAINNSWSMDCWSWFLFYWTN